jgi:MoxR-like ATPase
MVITMGNAQSIFMRIVDNIEKVIIGKRRTVELIVEAMASGGHVLIEDIPGVGKTSLVYALARSISCDFKRIQFTPDTLPSDITGFSVFNPKTNEFEFHRGAVMSNFILADEINRTTPKTQASLLEIMEECQVTVDTKTYKLDQPFMVLATQNPIEYLGTYPLPEAQIDRFLIKVSLGYPDMAQEAKIISMNLNGEKEQLRPVADAADIADVKKEVSAVFVDHSIKKYIVEIVSATRSHPDVLLGASPRGSISLYNICQAHAVYSGRNYVIPDDVKLLAPYVLSHRLILTHEAKISKTPVERIINQILNKTPVPALR